MNPEQFEDFEVVYETPGFRELRGFDTAREREVLIRSVDTSAIATSTDADIYVQTMQSLILSDQKSNVAAVYHVEHTKESITVISENLECDNLQALLTNGLPVRQLSQLCNDLFLALLEYRELGTGHGQVFPANIYFDPSTDCFVLDVPTLFPDDQIESVHVEHVELIAPEIFGQRSASFESDLYALGSLIYRTLTGSFLWTDEEGYPRLPTPEDTVRRLPEEFAPMQDFLTTILAWSPLDRLVEQQHLSQVLEQFAERGTQKHEKLLRSGVIEIDEVQEVIPELEVPSASAEDTSQGLTTRQIYAMVTGFTTFSVMALMFSYFQFQPVQVFFHELGLGEHPELTELWQTAESIRSDPNQTLSAIRGAYNQVLDVDPGHVGAIGAIDEVKNLWMSEVSTAIQENKLPIAKRKLNELDEVYPNDESVIELGMKLDQRGRAERIYNDTEQLWDTIQAKLQRPETETDLNEEATRLEAATDAYLLVQSLWPENVDVRMRLNRIFEISEEKVLKIRVTEDEDSRPLQLRYYELALKTSPNAEELSAASEQVAQAGQLINRIDFTLQRGKELLDQGRLIGLEGESSAWKAFQEVLQDDPENETARQHIANLEPLVIRNHTEALETRQFADADRLFAAAIEAPLGRQATDTMLKNRQELQGRIDEANRLYQQAKALFDLGRITKPAGMNALEVLATAQQLDEQNTEVNTLLMKCATRLVQVAEQLKDVGELTVALDYLERALEIDPNNEEWLSSMREWSPD